MAKSFYKYEASKVAAAIFFALFLINFLVAVFFTVRKRSWIWIVQLLSILLEVVGFGARIMSVGDVTNKGLYVAQYSAIILAPITMAGVIYVVFGRIVFHVIPPHERTKSLLWVPARWITPIFVTFDIFSLALQLIGAIQITSVDVGDEDYQKKQDLGKTLALVGIFVQIAAFGLFSVVAVRFHFVSKRFAAGLHARLMTMTEGKGQKSGRVAIEGCRNMLRPKWQHLLLAVNMSCLLIFIRSIYRVVEFVEGPRGETSTHEWYLYVFDGAPILIVCTLFNLFFPGSYLPFMGFRVPKTQERQLHSSDGSSLELRQV